MWSGPFRGLHKQVYHIGRILRDRDRDVVWRPASATTGSRGGHSRLFQATAQGASVASKSRRPKAIKLRESRRSCEPELDAVDVGRGCELAGVRGGRSGPKGLRRVAEQRTQADSSGQRCPPFFVKPLQTCPSSPPCGAASPTGRAPLCQGRASVVEWTDRAWNADRSMTADKGGRQPGAETGSRIPNSHPIHLVVVVVGRSDKKERKKQSSCTAYTPNILASF